MYGDHGRPSDLHPVEGSGVKICPGTSSCKKPRHCYRSSEHSKKVSAILTSVTSCSDSFPRVDRERSTLQGGWSGGGGVNGGARHVLGTSSPVERDCASRWVTARERDGTEGRRGGIHPKIAPTVALILTPPSEFECPTWTPLITTLTLPDIIPIGLSRPINQMQRFAISEDREYTRDLS